MDEKMSLATSHKRASTIVVFLLLIRKTKKPENTTISGFLNCFVLILAEREGFEPPDLLQSTVFKTAAFDRSAISPRQK